ncbi:DUF2852 domain-containing protein [Parvularcula lutaonensis]|uniref:DUF2852 domain-containing protein n=1 Tax=Parvularcula lutaonensis TaxID=491923 RepID=A0ABV7MC25_9PROT|nr:DUF2852 domain-containing protein [Parvularcula lutaonensis]GGY49081.1 membrane protein [Parvularcula lutaonensis]
MTDRTTTADKMFDEKTFQHQLRPAWTPVNIGLMILFFAVGLWPLGLAAIVYMMYGREMGLDFSNWGKAKSSVRRASHGCKWRSSRTSSSGNMAFDEWRDAELERLREEKRKLDEARDAFEQHMRDLRMAKDREEFDNFKRAWETSRAAATTTGDNPGTMSS